MFVSFGFLFGVIFSFIVFLLACFVFWFVVLCLVVLARGVFFVALAA